MFCVTKDGKRIDIDDSQFDDRDFYPIQETVGLYSDDAMLKAMQNNTSEKQELFTVTIPNDKTSL